METGPRIELGLGALLTGGGAVSQALDGPLPLTVLLLVGGVVLMLVGAIGIARTIGDWRRETPIRRRVGRWIAGDTMPPSSEKKPDDTSEQSAQIAELEPYKQAARYRQQSRDLEALTREANEYADSMEAAAIAKNPGEESEAWAYVLMWERRVQESIDDPIDVATFTAHFPETGDPWQMRIATHVTMRVRLLGEVRVSIDERLRALDLD